MAYLPTASSARQPALHKTHMQHTTIHTPGKTSPLTTEPDRQPAHLQEVNPVPISCLLIKDNTYNETLHPLPVCINVCYTSSLLEHSMKSRLSIIIEDIIIYCLILAGIIYLLST